MISIIIPHRGNDLGLWATVTSCQNELLNSGIEAEYIFITNGDKELNQDSLTVIEQLKLHGNLRHHEHFVEGLNPPEARQIGSTYATGEFLFFFDNHCLVTKDYFKRALLDFNTYDIDLLHSTTQYYIGDMKCYHYNLKLNYNFWGRAASLPRQAMKPYQIAAGGHGGFAVRRSAWEEVGGYGPKELFDGYGGEEVYVDLKFWLYGKKVWLDPLILHYHFAGARGYKRHYYDDYYTNMLASANLIGGEKWLNTVFESFCDGSKHTRFSTGSDLTDMFDLYAKALDRTEKYRKELFSKYSKTLDELLVWFRENDIAC